MIAWAAVGLVAAAALAYVLAAVGAGAAAGTGGEPVAELEARKLASLAAIVDLEDELAVGKLSRADFAALSSRYEREALVALRELDAARAQPPPDGDDDGLEREIAAVRARLECPRCGALRRAEGPCARCGR